MCQGVYAWQTVADAEVYAARRRALRFMTPAARPGLGSPRPGSRPVRAALQRSPRPRAPEQVLEEPAQPARTRAASSRTGHGIATPFSSRRPDASLLAARSNDLGGRRLRRSRVRLTGHEPRHTDERGNATSQQPDQGASRQVQQTTGELKDRTTDRARGTLDTQSSSLGRQVGAIGEALRKAGEHLDGSGNDQGSEGRPTGRRTGTVPRAYRELQLRTGFSPMPSS